MASVRKRRVLAIGLDGYEHSLGERMMTDGELPALAALKKRSARYVLEHGGAQRTGLAGEHFSTGLSPADASKWAAVCFDPETYATWQEGTSLVPFPAHLQAKTVVFDMTYFDLARAPDVGGVVGWGAHDAGVCAAAQPHGLLQEFLTRFGPYPANQWIYAIAWPSPEHCRQAGEGLAAAARLRSDAARWLFGERLPDWDLGLLFVSEPHSAVEALWHGVDPSHPLHKAASGPAAGDALKRVYRAVDELCGDMVDAFGDATVLVFSMAGMGPNRSDIQSMALLPELLYRDAFGSELLKIPADWSAAPRGLPLIPDGKEWVKLVAGAVGESLGRRAARELGRKTAAVMRRLGMGESGPARFSLDWMPAARYQPHWRKMRAFALPSFYDGRIRINLTGRESRGLVAAGKYRAELDRLESLLRECTDISTGEPVVDRIERSEERDPRTLNGTESDMIIIWRGVSTGFDHPRLGRIGPLPLRRTGGHSRPHGFAYLAGEGIDAMDCGIASSFDVVPTLIDLVGEPVRTRISGRSLRPVSPAFPREAQAALKAGRER